MKTRKHVQIAIFLVILLSSCTWNESKIEVQLQGMTWSLSAYNDTQPIAGHHPILEFQADQFSGTTGCNHYGGTYQIDEESIRFEGVFSTEMACLEPEGLMEQERIYLELLRTVERFELIENVLTFYTESNPILVFEIQSDEPVSTEPTIEPDEPISIDPAPSPTSLPVITPPESWDPYQDQITGISIFIPETWIVTGIFEGERAVLQSYPVDKYVGGEPLAEGDTKCDLAIQPTGLTADELIGQWKDSPMTTIVSEATITLNNGQEGYRFEIESMGRSISVVVELAERTVVMTCFGDFSQVDEIAATLNDGE